MQITLKVNSSWRGVGFLIGFLTSIISSRGNSSPGMSVALHAIRYPYNTRSTLSWATIRRSFCSRSSSRMIGSSRTARSWYDCMSSAPVSDSQISVTNLGSWVPMVVRIGFVLAHLIWVHFAYPPRRQLLTHTGIKLSELRPLSDGESVIR